LSLLNYLIIAFFVSGVVGAHQPVPKVKIQSVIAAGQPVVHVMVR